MNRPFEILDVQQGSDEWLAARAGRVTGSNASYVISKENASGGETAGKVNYRMQLAIERMTGKPMMDDFQSKHTRHGTEWEPIARIVAEQETGLVFRETGFLRHTTKMIGVSLDGDADDFKTILEIKCPKPKTHVSYLQADKLPAIYRAQVMHSLYVTGAEQCIFVSYCDDMPDGLKTFKKVVKAKDLPLQEYDTALTAFLSSVDELHQRLIELRRKNESKV